MLGYTDFKEILNDFKKGKVVYISIFLLLTVGFFVTVKLFGSNGTNYASQFIGDHSTGNIQVQGSNNNINTPPQFKPSYKMLEESKLERSNFYLTTFEISVTRPQGNFQARFFVLPNINNAVCSKEKWLRTESAEEGGRQIYETSAYEIRCASELKIIDDRKLFSIKGVD